ncbi:sporulation-specific protein 22 [Pleosporales sp. CAS-2024a]
MAPSQPAAKLEREKKLQSVLAFGLTLAKRFEQDRDATLADDIQAQIRRLPLLPSSALTARQDELDRLGTELWNLSTRLRRDESASDSRAKEDAKERKRALSMLRTFAFLTLDSAAAHVKGRARKSCIRLMKVALKAARVCIAAQELNHATKILERAAEYQDILSKQGGDEHVEVDKLARRLRMEYFAVRITLAWRQERMDTAEHMYTKCKQLTGTTTPSSAEALADVLYEMGKDSLMKLNYEIAARWLERAYDSLCEQDIEMISPEGSELRLSTMHGIVQAYMKLGTTEAKDKAWNMLKLMETDYADKMLVSLLKIELLSLSDVFDSGEFYNGRSSERFILSMKLTCPVLLRMVRTVVLNDTNFRTIMHHVHKLKEHNNTNAGKIVDNLIDIRLFREENQIWIEKAIITRIWISTNNPSANNIIEELHELLETASRNMEDTFSAPATHAAQTLLWKRVDAAYSQDQFAAAEAWCRICLHPVFDKAGAQNQDFPAAREAYKKMSDSGREEPVTRYLMYKVGIKSHDVELVTECLDRVSRDSAKDATLLYACVMEAQGNGDKRQAIAALECVLDKYEYSAPAGVHLPALLRLLKVCAEFIKLLRDSNQSGADGDLGLRLVFCEFLASCAYATLARAEDNIEGCLQYYLEVRKHSQDFRRAAAEGIDKLGGAAQADIISKHFQIVKLELEAVLKLEKWDELDDLFEQCWKYKTPDHYETLADLVIVIHSCIVQANADEKYQRKVLSVLDKIIRLTSCQAGADVTKLARWIRCLFKLALTYDESISLRCIELAVTVATKQRGVTDDDIKESDRYPPAELEWLATTIFNHAIDYYMQEKDEVCTKWAQHAFIVAQWLEDGGSLRDLLMEKYASLGLSNRRE